MSSSFRPIAPGDIHEGSGREGRLVGQQPENCPGDLVGSPPTFHGDRLLDAVDATRLPAARMHLRVNEARPNGVYANAFLGDLPGEPDREGVEGAL